MEFWDGHNFFPTWQLEGEDEREECEREGEKEAAEAGISGFLEGHNSRFGFQREKRERPGLLSQEREKKGGKKKRLGQLFFLFRVAGVRVTPPLQEVTLCFCPINTALSLSPPPPSSPPQ